MNSTFSLSYQIRDKTNHKRSIVHTKQTLNHNHHSNSFQCIYFINISLQLQCSRQCDVMMWCDLHTDVMWCEDVLMCRGGGRKFKMHLYQYIPKRERKKTSKDIKQFQCLNEESLYQSLNDQHFLFIACMTSHCKAFFMGRCIISKIIFFPFESPQRISATQLSFYLCVVCFCVFFPKGYDDTTSYWFFLYIIFYMNVSFWSVLKFIRCHHFDSCMNASSLRPKQV